MAKKFIPNGDLDFATMATSFANTIAKEPARFEILQDDANALRAAVDRYDAAYQKARYGERTASAVRLKDAARDEAEEIIRRLANQVRANKRMDSVARVLLGLRERTAKAKMTPCPIEPPRLEFVRALHEGGGATPAHELRFCAMDRRKAKPAGAVRLELFVDLVPPEEDIPTHPAASQGSRAWYLRSFTRSPVVLVPPIARVPMRVVYWARWADSVGGVGPFSATCVGWIEGGSHQLLAPALGSNKAVPMIETTAMAGPSGRGESYRVAVLEVQMQSFRASVMPSPAELPAPAGEAMRRLEGPAREEAA